MYKKHIVEGYTRLELENLINERILGQHADRNRRLIYRRLCDGITYECLAEEFDLSVNQVKNICYKLIEKL